MNIIHRIVRVVAAPEPPFVGTRIKIELPTAGIVFGFASMELNEGRTEVVVDWGDGQIETLTGDIGQITHVYATAGAFEIRLSDDLNRFGVSKLDAEEPFASATQYVTEIISNGPGLVEPARFGFQDARRLSVLELPHVTALTAGSFLNCTALPHVLAFPSVSWVGRRSDVFIFTGCDQIDEIHFAKANEEDITSLSAYVKDPSLGTGTAVCKFDL